ncbi:MAG: hypothetical protein FWG67_04320 [Defluviitaleaceae bacterium]|nr:hypothetical protein [Defluviitaleaceae bacterium]
MIEVLGYLENDIKYKIEYIKSINVINISTTLMNDNCVPYRIATAGIVWLNNDMVIGEMEYICPVISENNPQVKNGIDEVHGMPQLKINFEEKSTELVVTKEKLTLILDRQKLIERKCVSSNVVFYLSGNEIVAFDCTGFEIIE